MEAFEEASQEGVLIAAARHAAQKGRFQWLKAGQPPSRRA
jgi:hypothetical protein